MTIIIYDDVFLEHDTGYGHPESALRLNNTIAYLKTSGTWELKASSVDLPLTKPLAIG